MLIEIRNKYYVNFNRVVYFYLNNSDIILICDNFNIIVTYNSTIEAEKDLNLLTTAVRDSWKMVVLSNIYTRIENLSEV